MANTTWWIWMECLMDTLLFVAVLLLIALWFAGRDGDGGKYA